MPVDGRAEQGHLRRAKLFLQQRGRLLGHFPRARAGGPACVTLLRLGVAPWRDRRPSPLDLDVGRWSLMLFQALSHLRSAWVGRLACRPLMGAF